MQPLAGTIPPIAADPSPVSFGLRVRDMRMSLPAAARRGRLLADPRVEVCALRSRSVARNVAPLVAAVLSAALLGPAQPALAQFTQQGPKIGRAHV